MAKYAALREIIKTVLIQRNMQKSSRFFNIVTIVGIVILIAVAAINYKGCSIYVPEKSQPFASDGSFNVLSEKQNLSVGDIVAVERIQDEYDLHQVMDINEKSYLTEDEELYVLSKTYVVSLLSIPYAGYAYNFLFGHWKIYCIGILICAVLALVFGLLCEKEDTEKEDYNNNIPIQSLSGRSVNKKINSI